MAQLASALGLGPRGPPFESEYPDKKVDDLFSSTFLLFDSLNNHSFKLYHSFRVNRVLMALYIGKIWIF